jgi:hypothetical protein
MSGKGAFVHRWEQLLNVFIIGVSHRAFFRYLLWLKMFDTGYAIKAVDKTRTLKHPRRYGDWDE